MEGVVRVFPQIWESVYKTSLKYYAQFLSVNSMVFQYNTTFGLAIKVCRGEFLGTLAFARALRIQVTENIKNKSGVFPRYLSNQCTVHNSIKFLAAFFCFRSDPEQTGLVE